MGQTLTGPFRDVIGLGSCNTVIDDHLGPEYSDPYRAVVDLWRWSVREVLLYIYICDV